MKIYWHGEICNSEKTAFCTIETWCLSNPPQISNWTNLIYSDCTPSIRAQNSTCTFMYTSSILTYACQIMYMHARSCIVHVHTHICMPDHVLCTSILTYACQIMYCARPYSHMHARSCIVHVHTHICMPDHVLCTSILTYACQIMYCARPYSHMHARSCIVHVHTHICMPDHVLCTHPGTCIVHAPTCMHVVL